MLIQIIAIISSYFDYEIVNRFDVQQMKLLPNVLFSFEPLPSNISNLYEIYPQMKQEIKECDSFGEPLKYYNGRKKIGRLYFSLER
jgi:hypothetical protein